MTNIDLKNLRVLAKSEDGQMRIRISDDMKQILEKEARNNGRSLNNHILYLLRDSLVNSFYRKEGELQS